MTFFLSSLIDIDFMASFGIDDNNDDTDLSTG